MARKRGLPEADFCNMTAIPGRIAGSVQAISLDDAGEVDAGINLFTLSVQEANPVLLERQNRAITITQSPLRRIYDSQIAGFKSYYTPLLDFLKHDAFKYEEIGNTCTSLYFDLESSKLIAFCSTKCSSMKVKGDSILSLCPTVEIAALCVDDEYRFQGVGQAILQQILQQIQKVRGTVGVQFVTLFAVPGAVDFYKRFGFKKIGSAGKVLWSSAHLRCVPMYINLPRAIPDIPVQ